MSPLVSLFHIVGMSSSAVLPMTGGDGPLLVTVIGVSLASLSFLILFLRWRSSRKQKKRGQR